MKKANPLAVVLGLSAVFFVVFVGLSALLFLGPGKSGGRQGPVAGSLVGGRSVGVVEIKGVIMDSKKVLRALERHEEDSDVRAVVMRLDSPGGSVGPSQEIYEAVRKYKKPIVASMGSVAASGAFYVAMGAKKVYANPGSLTGSIGVIMQFADLSKLYEWAKVRRYALTTGRFKDSGAEYKEMDPATRALLQTMIDDVLAQFRQAVADGRKLSMPKVTAVADGRILSGSQAKELGLIDELGGLQDAVAEAARMAKIPGKPNVVYPDKPKGNKLLELLMDESGDEESASATSGGLLERVARLIVGGQGGDGAAIPALGSLTPGIYWLWTGAR